MGRSPKLVGVGGVIEKITEFKALGNVLHNGHSKQLSPAFDDLPSVF